MAAVITARDQALVVRHLRSVAPSWFEIGIRLHLSVSVLETIDMEYGSVEEKLSAVVREWLKMAGREANWQSLVQVLRSSGHSTLASKLEAQYSSTTATVLDRGNGQSAKLHSSSTTAVVKGNGGRPKLAQLVPIPLSASQCRQLAEHLSFSESDVVNIEVKSRGNENKLKRALFKAWLDRDEEASWSRVLEALDRVSSSLRDKVIETYLGDQQSRLVNKSSTTVHVVDEKDSPQSSGPRPVTMPLTTTTRTSPLRSSSSSYHSASNYDEPEDHSTLPPYHANAEPPVPRTLVKTVRRKETPSSFSSHGSSRSSKGGSRNSSDVPGELTSQHHLTSLRTPTTGSPRSTLATAGSETTTSSGRASPDEALVQEFLEAVKAWKIEAVERVLVQDRGVDVDMVVREKDGRSALMLASVADHPPMVRVLLKHKASTQAKDNHGFTALYLACSHGNYEIMKLLVEHFADVNARANDGTPMLLVPAQKGFSMVTQYLLENGANPNLADRDGITPLMAASKKGQRDVVKVLLANGADVTIVGVRTSRTALQEAIDNDHKEIVPLLIEATRKAKEKNQKLFTCKSAEEARELVTDNAKVDERRGDQATPLIVQVQSGNEEVVKELLSLGANIDLQDDEGESALMKACAKGNYSMVHIIVSHRAILDLKSKGGDTAVMYAVRGNHMAVVRELLLSGADPTIRNKNGQTTLGLAEELGSEVMVEEIMKHTAIADSKDPFINLLSGYLEKVTMKLTTVTNGGSKEPSVCGSESSHQTPAERAEDEESPLRDQLNKAWKRIADLETRVHDLTLQSTIEILDDTDLSFYDKKRLEAEYRKLKELKHKAEQYAVEAKQTAQRLSAENFKLKEDLSREQHFNELERKNFLRDMEAKMGQRRGEEEREQAKKEVMEQTIHARAQQLATTMKASNLELNVGITYKTIKDLILNQTVRANLALFIVTGLPFSGKSTVLKKLLNSSAQTSTQEMHGLTELEAAILRHEVRNISHWSVFQHQQLLLVTISLLKLAFQRHPFPKFPASAAASPNIFGEPDIDRCFSNIFRNLPLEMMNNEETRWMLTTGDISFVTAWDIGMNKAVFDVMVMIAPDCDSAVLLDFFSLNLDADTIDEIPNLGDKCYKGRYNSSRNDAEQLLRLRTKLEYLYYPMFVLANRPCVLVATHDGLPDVRVREKSEHVLRKIEMQFLSRDHSHLPLPHLVPVRYEEKEDIRALRRILEETISTSPPFYVQLPMKWVFLRTYLGYTKKMYIPLPELKAVAKHLHITNGEVMDFLKQFAKCGSIIHVTGLCPECSDEFVILRVAEFLKDVEKLYYIQENTDVRVELRERARLGYISRELADELWVKSSSHPPQRSGFFIHALRRMGILTALKQRPGEKAPREEYFMPRMRPKACNDPPAQSSLFLTHGAVFPFPLQSEFLTHFNEVLNSHFLFDPRECLNTLHFQTLEGDQDLTFRFMNGYIEVHGTGFSMKLRGIIKTACIEVMAAIKRQRPKLNLKYSLAALCPSLSPGNEKPHFANFRVQEDVDEIFCYRCLSMVKVSEESKEWIRATYSGSKSLVQSEAGKTLESFQTDTGCKAMHAISNYLVLNFLCTVLCKQACSCY
jgi:ankyrin repeat protein